MAGPELRPLVSVCIPVYNARPFVAAAIRSVLDQTLKDFELVIIDNASTDGTLDEVSQFNDPRIRVLRNPANIGAEGNWNRCLGEARGKYIKILPADDLLYPRILEKQVAVLEDPLHADVTLVCSRRDVLNEHGKLIVQGRGLKKAGKIFSDEAFRAIVRSGGNPLGEPHAVLFRAEDSARVGKFDGSAGYLIDLDYWCRLLNLGQLFCVPESLSAFRVSPNSWSTSVASSQARDTQQLWRKLQEQGLVSSSDVRFGDRMAKVMGVVRQALYVFLAVADRFVPKGRKQLV